jgi:rhodanese-related sulfurtransferase
MARSAAFRWPRCAGDGRIDLAQQPAGRIDAVPQRRRPDTAAEIMLSCCGFRSALTADNLQKMGRAKAISMDGGVCGWREKGYPMTTD